MWSGEAGAGWDGVDKLVDEQKFEEASRRVEEMLGAARAAGEGEQWTRCLVRLATMRVGLHGYDKALGFLRGEAWPDEPLARVALNLYLAKCLLTYADAYSWEINRRERVEAKEDAGPESWTMERIYAEAGRAFDAALRAGDALDLPAGVLKEYLTEGTYPDEVRPTVRDAVSYLYADFHCDTSGWRPEHANEIYRLDIEGLLSGDGLPTDATLRSDDGVRADAVALCGPAVHPLVKTAALLADLEARHRGAGRADAAVEARLERVRVLHRNFTADADRAAIRRSLEGFLDAARGTPWWSTGMALLAELVRDEDAPDARARGRKIALEGKEAFPQSVGGRRCDAIIKGIETPDFDLEGMASDAPGKPSIRVSYVNLPELYFRAYRLDLKRVIEESRDYSLLPDTRAAQELLARSTPAYHWKTALAPTLDYRTHARFVTPPMREPGLYVVVASGKERFTPKGNKVQAINLIVGDLVITSRQDGDEREVKTLSGSTGKPLAKAEVLLYRREYRSGHRAVAKGKTGRDGAMRFRLPDSGGAYFLVARRGDDAALDPDPFGYSRREPPPDVEASLIFTDRSIYRPGQTVHFKVVAYRGRPDEARLRTAPDASLTITLHDANYQEVGTLSVTTNRFGTASGSFTVPPGRMLGGWRLQSSMEGSASIRVEEYKRPTFEVTLKDPPEPLRLNRPAAVPGEARYYFGLPVAGGSVSWRVARVPVYPRWWSYYASFAADAREQVIATGTTPLADDGSFTVAFTPDADERLALTSKEISYRYSIAVDVTDEGGETRSASSTVRLGFVSIEASVETGRGFFLEGRPVALTVLRTDLNGAAAPGRGEYTVVRLDGPSQALLPAEQPLPGHAAGANAGTPNPFATPDDDKRSRWSPGYDALATLASWRDSAPHTRGEIPHDGAPHARGEIPHDSAPHTRGEIPHDGAPSGRYYLVHDARGRGALTLDPLRPGAYRLRYETVDPFGERVTAQSDFIVAGEPLPLPLPAVLLAEQSTVRVGDTARLLAHSGLAGQLLWLDVYRAGRLVARRDLESGLSSSVIEIPVTEEDRGGFAVTLWGVRDHQFIHLAAAIAVPWDDKQLAIEFQTFRDRLQPGAREKWIVKVARTADRDAAVEAAELLAYMYDRSLDAFAAHAPPVPLSLFPRRASYAVVCASLGDSRTVYVPSDGFPQGGEYPSLRGHELVLFAGYGIGGPGARRWIAFLRPGGVRSMMAPPMTCAASVYSAGGPPEEAISEDVSEMAMEGDSTGEFDAKASMAPPSANGAPPAAGAPFQPPVELRSDFSETAFFLPHLVTASDGSASLEFTVPDSVTSWNVWVHAVTREFDSGSAAREVRTVKDLMVRPYLPRFLREGDRADIKVVVNNAASAPLAGELTFDIVDAETEERLLAAFGHAGDAPWSVPFTAPPGGGTDLVFTVTAPPRPGLVAVKVTARTAGTCCAQSGCAQSGGAQSGGAQSGGPWSEGPPGDGPGPDALGVGSDALGVGSLIGARCDGEIRPIPVLPGRMHLAQSRFATLQDGGSRVLSFADLARNDDPTLQNERLVVTLDAQLFYSVLQALPYLATFPYECTEQLLNRFLSTGILTSLFRQYPAVADMARTLAARATPLERFDAPDPNRAMALEETPWLVLARGGEADQKNLVNVLDPELVRARRKASLEKLEKAQTGNGGFPWFPGGPPSPFMTLYLLHGFAKGLEFGIEAPRDMTSRAWGYLRRHYVDSIVADMQSRDTGWETVSFLLYVLSAYPDASWTGGVFDDEERGRMLDFAFRHRREHSPYLKGYLTLALARAGRSDDARLVWDSVMDSARTEQDQGTFWAAEDRSWLWYNDTIESHAFALRVCMELTPADPKIPGLVLWLFLNKKLNHWKSTRATAEVIYSLAHYFKATGGLARREEASVVIGGERREFVFEPAEYTGKKNQIVVPGDEVDPARHSSITIEQAAPGFLLASATWHFSTDRLPAETRGDYLQVARRFYLRDTSGREAVLRPLDEGAGVRVGDEVEVHLSLRSKHAMEYVHVRDPRPAGFEPAQALSRFRWDLGVGCTEEVRDSGMNFFFEYLPQGEYTFKHRIRAATAGAFKAAPATAQPMYAPEFAAYSAGAAVAVEAAR